MRGRITLHSFKEINVHHLILRFIFLIAVLFSTPLFAYLKTTHMVAMRDGVKLATDVYLADASAQKWPAILIRTPYGKSGFLTPTNTFDGWVKAGYAIVVQDTRGRYDSQGADSLFLDDGWSGRQDGYDTVEWTAVQSWCNGKVGTLGASALGITQYIRHDQRLCGIAAQRRHRRTRQTKIAGRPVDARQLGSNPAGRAEFSEQHAR